MNETELIKTIAYWCIDYGTDHSTNGSYYIYANDIAERFGVTQEWLSQNNENIADYIDGSDEIIYTTDLEYDDNGNFESFGLWFTGNALCTKCGCQNSESCCECEVAHPEEWDEEIEEEPDITPARELKKAIKNYNLHKIHTGRLSDVPSDRYVRSSICFDVNELNRDLTEKKFVMVFNHYEWSYGCWTVWETPYMDFQSIKEIYDKEHHRKLWDSNQLYYDDGNKVVNLCL